MANSVDPDQNRSSLFWVHAVCFYTKFVSNVRQLFAADDFSRRHFQMYFFTWRFRVKPEILKYKAITFCMLCNFYDFVFLVCCFFFKVKFEKKYQECQTVWIQIQIRSDVLSSVVLSFLLQ